MTHLDSYQAFIEVADLYKLGFLPTEMSHSLTRKLSDYANENPQMTAELFYQLDIKTIETVLAHTIDLEHLTRVIQETLKNNNRVFLCGCGATGRLALALESYWRRLYPESADKLISFMAGGDIALVNSLEGFEDHPEYGHRHLQQLGFRKNDLLIGITEGGETPYVLGAIESAANISTQNAFMICCNPKDILRKHIKRSRDIIDHKNTYCIHLEIGPMALSGSTRLQATTALMCFMSLALLSVDQKKDIKELKQALSLESYHQFLPLTIFESEVYKKNNYIHYEVSESLALAVFTDTTERSPTFSTPSFEPTNQIVKDPSWCYISVIDSRDSNLAWKFLLGREPRCLNWNEDIKTSLSYLKQFDFSEKAKEYRISRLKKISDIKIVDSNDKIKIIFEDQMIQIQTPTTLWIKDLILKMLINYHSTVLMCRLGRVKSNMMTWVRPSNGKLIDRATRYLIALTSDKIKLSYNEALEIIMHQKLYLNAGESIIQKSIEFLEHKKTDKNLTT